MESGRPALTLLRDSFPLRPAYGTAISEAILARVAAGEQGATLRLHRPGAELALSKQDRVAPGFAAAAAAGRERGFEPVLRLAGGRAAAFHEGTIAFAMATPETDAVRSTRERFGWVAGALAEALGALGVEARVGEVAGEYCPGEWSVNARGAAKLAGIGQRLIAGGAHVGGVVVVSDSTRLRELLVAVYDALGIDWDPATVGSIEDEIGPVTMDAVEDVLLERIGRDWELREGQLDPAVSSLAESLEDGRMVA